MTPTPEPTARLDIADGCTNVRVEDGAEVPCGRPAVALRIDPEFREYGPYPVCVGHVRHPMVPLANWLAAHDAQVAEKAWDEAFFATTSAAPETEWFPEWDDLTNPYQNGAHRV